MLSFSDKGGGEPKKKKKTQRGPASHLRKEGKKGRRKEKKPSHCGTVVLRRGRIRGAPEGEKERKETIPARFFETKKEERRKGKRRV